MNFILQELLAPLVRRVGTASSAFLIGYGVEQASADMISAGIGAAIMVGAELLASHANRKLQYTRGQRAARGVQ